MLCTYKFLEKEFERQVKNLIQKGYPKVIGFSKQKFLRLLKPLKVKLKGKKLSEVNIEKGRLPFVIVFTSKLLSAEKSISLVEKDGKCGVTILRPHTSKNFEVIKDIMLPKNSVYLLLDIDRGKESVNKPPSQAFKKIRKAKRLPLTIDEGVSVLTQFPEFLFKNNCFSLLGSRTGIDKRVPAVWINAKKQPNLGWCWEGNPHTWLGSASAAQRVG